MLKSIDRDAHAEGREATILEQWRTCVEMANSNTEKRNNTNNLFITINAALFAVVTFAGDYKSILLSTIGIVVCILWLTSVRSYRQLSQVKYDIINEIEKQLPLAPFTNEWGRLRLEHNYVGLTKIEKFLPWLFLVLYAAAILWPLVNSLFTFLRPCIGGST